MAESLSLSPFNAGPLLLHVVSPRGFSKCAFQQVARFLTWQLRAPKSAKVVIGYS